MKKRNIILLLFLLFVLLPVSVFWGFYLSLRDRIYYNITVSEVDVGRMTKSEAEQKLLMAFEKTPKSILVTLDGKELGSIEVGDIKRDFKWAVEQAYLEGKSGNYFIDIKNKISLLFERKDIDTPLIVEDEVLETLADTVTAKVEVEAIFPSLVKKNGYYSLVEGKDGIQINRQAFLQKVKTELTKTKPDPIDVKTNIVSAKSDPLLSTTAIKILNEWKDQKVMVKHKEYAMYLDEKNIANLIGLRGEFLNSDEANKIINEIVNEIETEPKDAVFEFVDGKVKEFIPEVLGVNVDKPKLLTLLEDAIREKREVIEVPVINSEAKIKVADINNFGIKELIAVGKSSFSHSIPSRVFNVNLAASRINGVIIPPGEEFSFNKAVGEISRQTGYQTAYVISQGKTVLGDGGGVCQVSTTVFRAALDFGFPITERKAHAYRVSYYEQDSSPGLDATIFSPSTDFKFKNDTGHHILIQSKVDTKNLTMKVEIYGTHDGRKSTISKPTITSQTPAPATVYVDDPTLPKGTKKQIDWSASGAKVNFDYKVEKNSEILFERKFVSNYQPWRAVYLVGTKE